MSWLLDADVLSQPAKRTGDARAVAWIESEQDHCYTSSVVIAQLTYWVRTKQGKSRLTEAMHGRILGFNASVAHVWAEQQHQFVTAGLRMPVEDRLHRGNGPSLQPHNRHRQRKGFPAPD